MLMKEKNEGEKVIFKKSFAESKKKTLGEEFALRREYFFGSR
jgi:hypothetical protein